MAIEQLQEGAHSATFFVPSDEPSAHLGPTQWSSLLPGKLKDLLNTTYLTEVGDLDWVAFMRAWTTAGTSWNGMIADNGDVGFGYWRLSTGDGSPGNPAPKGVPIFFILAAGAYGASIRIQTSYSASE